MNRALALSSCALALSLALPLLGCGVGGAVRAVSSASRAARGASRVARGSRTAAKLGTSASKGAARGAGELSRVPLPLAASDELARASSLDELARVGKLDAFDELGGLVDLAGYGLDGLDIVLASSEGDPEAPTYLFRSTLFP